MVLTQTERFIKTSNKLNNSSELTGEGESLCNTDDLTEVNELVNNQVCRLVDRGAVVINNYRTRTKNNIYSRSCDCWRCGVLLFNSDHTKRFPKITYTSTIQTAILCTVEWDATYRRDMRDMPTGHRQHYGITASNFSRPFHAQPDSGRTMAIPGTGHARWLMIYY